MNRSRIAQAGLLATLLAGASTAAAEPSLMPLREQLKNVIHLGRFTAVDRVQRAHFALEAEQYEQAAELLRRAVAEDPFLVPAWSALAAAQLARCRLQEARFAAQHAALLDPAEPIPRRQLKAIREARCSAVPPASTDPAELALLTQPQSPVLWWQAALERAEQQEWWSALFFAARAESEGFARRDLLPEAARWLLRAGQFDAARHLTDELGDRALEQEIVSARLAVAPEVAALRHELSPLLLDRPEVAADQLVTLLESLVATTAKLDHAARLELVLDGLDLLRPGRQRFAAGEFRAPPGWSRQAAERSGALLELVLWPGDTMLSWYAAPVYDQPEAAQRWVQSKLPVGFALAATPWSECADSLRSIRCFDFEIALSSGARMQARWLQLDLNRAVVRVRSIGTGGCGAGCREQFARAADQIETDLSWNDRLAWQESQLQASWDLALPSTVQGETVAEESREPWRTYPIGRGWQIDLPPGVVAVDHDPFAVARSTAEGVWWRGRFRDRAGIEVQVGDAERLARVTWSDSGTPPVMSPVGTQVSQATLDPVLQQVGSRFRGTVTRSRDGHAHLEWLTFALKSPQGQASLQIPVREGAESLSLLWIPLTLRAAGEAGPPPIVELGSRGSVRFLKLAKGATAADPREGMLACDRFEVAIPKGFQIALSPSSDDGFPILARNKQRAEFRFEHLPETPISAADAAQQVRDQLGVDRSVSVQESTRGRTRIFSVESAMPSGRQAAMLVGYAGSDSIAPVVMIKFTTPDEVNAQTWHHLIGLVLETIKVTAGKH